MSDEKKPSSYRDLLVWQKGIELAKGIYELTKTFPREEKYGLISQMRRAAVSVPSNRTGEFLQFISFAEGSLAELDTQIILSIELGLLGPARAEPTASSITELRKMLNGLRHKLQN